MGDGDASGAGTLEEEQEGKRAAAAYACEGRRYCPPRCVVPAIPSSSFPDPCCVIHYCNRSKTTIDHDRGSLARTMERQPSTWPDHVTPLCRGGSLWGSMLARCLQLPGHVASCRGPSSSTICKEGVSSDKGNNYVRWSLPGPSTTDALPGVKNKNLPCTTGSRPCARTRLTGSSFQPMSTTGMRLWMLL